jgi:hypothetical protein
MQPCGMRASANALGTAEETNAGGVGAGVGGAGVGADVGATVGAGVGGMGVGAGVGESVAITHGAAAPVRHQPALHSSAQLVALPAMTPLVVWWAP